MTATKRIPVSKEIWASLSELKRPGETFDGLLAAMVDPQLAARNLRRLSDEGRAGPYGFYEAIDYTHSTRGDLAAGEGGGLSGGTLVRASWPTTRA
jgi:hypothetical protein